MHIYPQTLQKEIQGHQPRCDDILERSQSIQKADSLNVEAIQARLSDLQQLWSLIIQETEKRHARLEEAHKAQQYYFDAAEAEAWMSEQELYMMSEEKAKVWDVPMHGMCQWQISAFCRYHSWDGLNFVYLRQRFSIPVLAPPRSAYFVCYSYRFRCLFYSNVSALRSGRHRIFLHDSSSKRTYIFHSKCIEVCKTWIKIVYIYRGIWCHTRPCVKTLRNANPWMNVPK